MIPHIQSPSWRTGFADGLFNRPACSPYGKDHPKAAHYLAGYLYGDSLRVKHDLKPLSEIKVAS